jgi:hypothetical protein
VKKVLAAIFLALIAQLLFIDICWAATQDEGLVEITYPVDTFASYKDRRITHGANVGINITNFVPYNWESQIDGEYYGDTFGATPISLFCIEMGYKFNFVMGSISLMPGIGFGEQKADFNGVSRTMNVMKFSGKGMFALDNLFSEPYLVPYAAASVWQMRITEFLETSTEKYVHPTGIGLEYSFGALIQLNWLEPDLARQSLSNSGLQNTYIDLYVSQHMNSSSTNDPSTITAMDFGAGLRLEF